MSKDQNETLVHILEDFKTENCKHEYHRTSCMSNNFVSNDSKRKHSIDSFVTPEKMSKLMYEESTIASPWETRRLKAELIEARSRITLLENQIQQLHGVRKELELVFENEKKTLQSQHDSDKYVIEKLETRLNLIRIREAETKEELVQVESKFKQLKLNTDKKIETLQRIIDRVKNEAFERTYVDQGNCAVMSQRLTELQDLRNAAQDDANAQKKLVSELQAQLNEVNATQRSLEIKDQALQAALLKIKELEFERDSYLEWQLQTKIQQGKLLKYPELEKENEKLRNEIRLVRDTIHNKLLLEEQVQDLQKRIESYKDLQQELNAYNVKCSHLESVLEEWRSIARNVCDCVGSDSMLPQLTKKVIEHLQQQEVVLTSEKMSIDSDLKSCQRELNSVKQENDQISKQFSDLQTLNKDHQNIIHRLRKKLMLVSRERDSYRSQLDSYEKELTVLIPSGSSSITNDTQKDRIEYLEKNVEAYKELVNKLEADLEAVNPSLSLAPVRVEQMKRLQIEIDRLKSDNANLIKRRTELEQKLEQQALQNEQASGQNKILHFEMNPLSEAQKKHEKNVVKLNAEIEKLRRKVKTLEDGIEQSRLSESITVTGSQTQEIETLRKQCESYELKVQRLKEAFQSTAREYRDVCYMLLGYKIDRTPANNYRLSSMYAESPDDNLCFQLNSEGTMNLLETPFSITLENHIDLHLRQQDSIPMFLSAITMDLYSKTTMCMQTKT